MQFSPPLVPGTLIRRYKRFLADVTLDDGSTVIAHCPNTGSMMACCDPGSRVWLSPANNPKRKLAFTWELVQVADDALACIHTGRPNAVMGDLLRAGLEPTLAGYRVQQAEVRYGSEKSRIDWLLSGHDSAPQAWVEVKNVTLGEAGIAYFPDAVTLRGQKHLRELMACVAQGDRGVLLFCVSHTGVSEVRPADGIDPVYGQLLRQAVAAGVECYAWQLAITPEGMGPARSLPVVLS
ncbi:MAG: DNA/RNA nuclease SfsA [Halomonadaceae bacterium]|nr:MAG: DNA/RNA nuclease SfsA [Halomonadaceae bacterium]